MLTIHYLKNIDDSVAYLVKNEDELICGLAFAYNRELETPMSAIIPTYHRAFGVTVFTNPNHVVFTEAVRLQQEIINWLYLGLPPYLGIVNYIDFVNFPSGSGDME